MNTRFVLRGAILALVVLALAASAAVIFIGQGRIASAPDATPLPPRILASRGEMPIGPVGLLESAQYGEAAYTGVGCGFLVRLANGDLVGVTTAHSLSFSNAVAPLRRIALSVAGQTGFVIEFDTLRGTPGRPRSGEDMTVDYVLLQVGRDQSIDLAFILTPDPRGGPQAGERVSLFSGLGDGRGERRILEGTVQSASDAAVWVLMDGTFEPSGMSGSPFVSQYTGQVVGMAIATTHRAGRIWLGVHPIGSIVRLAEAAREFLKIENYRR